MRSHRQFLVMAMAGALLIQIGSAFGDVIINPDALLDVSARDGGGKPGVYSEDYPTALPIVGRTLSIVDGRTSSTSVYNLSNAGFSMSIDQARAPSYDSSANSYMKVPFSVTTETTYRASGTYSSVDPPNWSSPSTLQLHGKLWDAGTGQVLFWSDQQFNTHPNQTLTLGGAGGDYPPNLKQQGALSGTLQPGHNYVFECFGQDYGYTYVGNTASGQIDLAFSTVPEPSAVMLLSGVLVFTASRRLVRIRTKRPLA